MNGGATYTAVHQYCFLTLENHLTRKNKEENNEENVCNRGGGVIESRHFVVDKDEGLWK